MQYNKILRNKKGFQDIIYLMIFLFITSILIITVSNTFNKISTNMVGMDNLSLTNESKTVINDSIEKYSIFDKLFIFLMIGLGLAIVMTAFLIRVHPAFIFVNIIILFFFIFLSMILSNVFETIVSDSTLISTSANYPIITFLFNYFPYVILVIDVIVMIVMYAKTPGG